MILVADDDAELRGAIVLILGQKHEVREAPCGREALEAMALRRPDLLILDMTMPDMDGIEVLVEIRKTLPSLPVIVLTAVTDIGRAVRALDLGAKSYVTKPFDPEVLADEVSRALAGTPRPDATPWRVNI